MRRITLIAVITTIFLINAPAMALDLGGILNQVQQQLQKDQQSQAGASRQERPTTTQVTTGQSNVNPQEAEKLYQQCLAGNLNRSDISYPTWDSLRSKCEQDAQMCGREHWSPRIQQLCQIKKNRWIEEYIAKAPQIAEEKRDFEETTRRQREEELSLQAKREAEAKARAAAEENSKIQAEKRKADILAGKIPVQNFDDAKIKFSALEGGGIISSPPIDADRKIYAASGIIKNVVGTSNKRLLCEFIWARDSYFAVDLDNQTINQGQLRINGNIKFVGKYVDNIRLPLTNGSEVIAPVFAATYVSN